MNMESERIIERSELPISITLKNGSDRERIIQERLETLLRKYSLNKWILHREVIIEEGVRPHSYPDVTLNTKTESEEELLAQFLHEQIHWLEDSKEVMLNAIIELKALYPDAPIGRPEGADNERSTYRHLIVCRLEYLALSEYIGKETTQDLFNKNKGYTWIYKTVQEDGEKIDPIIKKFYPNVL